MMMKLKNVVPFGRSFDEYRLFFDLSESDLDKSIIGVGDGPASFNAEMCVRGKRLISVDPLYQFSSSEIETRFYKVLDDIIEQIKVSPNNWVWGYHQSPERLKENKINVIRQFLYDYEAGKEEGRYIIGELPHLNFEDKHFDLALCSHFLFLYSDQLDFTFHKRSIAEMLRIAREVRIFPLLTLMLRKSPYLNLLISELQLDGYEVCIQRVNYELQKGGNEMLVIKSPVNKSSSE